MRRLSRLVPDRYARFAARFAVPLAALAVLLVLGVGAAAAALVTPGGFGVPAARLVDTTELPQTLLDGELSTRDGDLDGLSDSLENYLYGTDPADWNSSGTGIPDGWLAQFGFDPLSPLVGELRGRGPDAATLPAAYADGYPLEYRPHLADYYAYARPDAYRAGVDAPWWRVGAHADPGVVDQAGTGVPTGWLLHHGLDVVAPDVDRVAPGSTGNLTIREAFEHDTDPLERDSDGDGIDDWTEIHVTLTDPSELSTARTGVADGWLLHFGLDAFDPDVASEDPDLDGLTNREEFLFSYDALRDAVLAEGMQALYARGLDPGEWETAATGIPDGWYVRYGLSPFGADVDRVVGRASEWSEVRDLDAAPEGFEPKPDLVMTIRDAYAYGRPHDWNETLHGVWWGGTNPATLDTDEDGMPDPVEIRGWYGNVSFDVGPEPKRRVYNATSNPLEADSDGDGLSDLEEYRGIAACEGGERDFPPTDPRNRDTAFSGLTDLEKVCGVVRGSVVYDLGARPGAVKLDPTRADSDGDYLRDGDALAFWHGRFANLTANPRYPYDGSAYRTIYEWTDTVPRFRGLSKSDVLAEFRPDGDVDDDGLPNMLDKDPSGGLYVDALAVPGEPRTKEFFLAGPEIDPALYRFTEFATEVPHARSDPANFDTDGDGLPDSWEIRYGRFDSARGIWNLDPAKKDSDADGVSDADANNDGDRVVWYAFDESGRRTSNEFTLSNLLEFASETDPNADSSVGDGVSDAWKVFWTQRVSSSTYPSLVSARDPRIGTVALEQANAIENAISSATTIRPLAEIGGLASKTAGYIRLVTLDNCDAPGPALEAVALPGEEVPASEPCVEAQDVNGTPLVMGRLEGVHELTYADEARLGTNPFLPDTDGDGSPDAYEAYHARPVGGGVSYPSPVVSDGGRERDADGDGAGHAAECGSPDGGKTCGVHVNAAFTRDGVAYGAGADPHVADTDRDGLSDGIELGVRNNPLDPADVRALQGDTDADGVSDADELRGWGALDFDVAVRTDHNDADTDGDGAIDGGSQTRYWLVPTKPGRTLTDAQKESNAIVELWCSRGYAHEVEPNDTNAVALTANEWCGAGMTARVARDLRVDFPGERTYGGAARFGLRPDVLDSSGAGVPDGWLAYYNHNPLEDPVDASRYEAYRPDWWDETRHGVWWWGVPPGDETVAADLDADGLNDANGEDPFPGSLRLNRIVDAARTLADPADVGDWVADAPDAATERQRAQMAGDGAGDPAGARRAAREALDANGVPTRIDRARVAVLDFVAPEDITKGVPFPVTGRVVLNERHGGNGPLLEGTETDRVGVANRTVLVSFLRADRSTVVGAGFTGPDGSFAFNVSIEDTLVVDIPYEGIALLDKVSGLAVEPIVVENVSTGLATRGQPNRLVAWVYNTSATARPGDATYGQHSAFLPADSGVVRTTNATAFAASTPRGVSVYSDTRFTTTVNPALVNGGQLVGDVRLEDASGAPLANQPVVLSWAGSASPTRFTNLTTDRNGLVNVTNLGLFAAVRDADAYSLSAAFESPDPYLRSGEQDFAIAVRDPTSLVATVDRANVVVGDEVVVQGRLATREVALRGGGVAPSVPVADATVAIRLGSAEVAARTGADGAFTARVPVPATLGAGEQSLVVAFPGSETADASETLLTLAVKRTSSIVELPRLEGPRELTVTLSGRLLDNAGQGFAGPIEVHFQGARLARGEAAEDGSFSLGVPLAPLPLGTQTVRVLFAGDESHAPAENATTTRVTSLTRLEVESAPARIVRGESFEVRARLVDDQGDPVAGQAVGVRWISARAGADGLVAAPDQFLVTDAAGRVVLPVSTNVTEPAGNAEAAFTYDPPVTSVLEPAILGVPIEVRAGVALTLEPATVTRGATTAQGTLVDDRGTPLAGALVRLALDGERLGDVRTARDGSFELGLDLRDHALGRATLGASFLGTTSLAPAFTNATWLVQGPLTLELSEAGPFVRGEEAPVKGRLVDDRGEPVTLAMGATLDGADLGAVRAVAGALEAKVRIPASTERGEHALVLRSVVDDRYPVLERNLTVVVKIRPKVDVDLPAVAVRGFSFGGDVTLLDDRGEPLRNTTFVYTLGGDGRPILGETGADGKARLASVAPLSGDAVLALTVRGGGDVVPSDYRTETLRVIGPATPVGYFTLVVAVLGALALAAVVVVAVVMRRRQLGEVRQILEEAINELLAGNEYAGTIFLAYRRMAALLARHGYLEKESQTPREFAAGIRKALPVGGDGVKELIRLFEEARYSDHPIGSVERDRAVDSLSRVRNELDQILGKEAKPT